MAKTKMTATVERDDDYTRVTLKLGKVAFEGTGFGTGQNALGSAATSALSRMLGSHDAWDQQLYWMRRIEEALAASGNPMTHWML